MNQPNNPYPGYGQPPGHGGYPQAPPGSSPYPMAPGPPPGGPRPGYPPQQRGGGTSKALPVIAGIGLAVGVCLGLLMVRGTGKSDAATPPKTTVEEIDADAGAVAAATPDAAPEPAVTADAAVEAAIVPDAAPAAPAVRTVVVELDVLPKEAEVTVDGEVIEGERYEIELAEGDKKKVKFKATAEGYVSRGATKTITEDTTVKLRLPKKRGGGTSGGGGRRRNNDGLIDL